MLYYINKVIGVNAIVSGLFIFRSLCLVMEEDLCGHGEKVIGFV